MCTLVRKLSSSRLQDPSSRLLINGMVSPTGECSGDVGSSVSFRSAFKSKCESNLPRNTCHESTVSMVTVLKSGPNCRSGAGDPYPSVNSSSTDGGGGGCDRLASMDFSRISCSSCSRRSKMARLAGSNLFADQQRARHTVTEPGRTYDDRSVGVVMHLAPTFSQNEHEGFLLSHLVLRARHTWQALLARLRG